MKPLVHGRQGYQRGCDCEICKEGNREYHRHYQHTRKDKEPTPLPHDVDWA